MMSVVVIAGVMILPGMFWYEWMYILSTKCVSSEVHLQDLFEQLLFWKLDYDPYCGRKMHMQHVVSSGHQKENGLPSRIARFYCIIKYEVGCR